MLYKLKFTIILFLSSFYLVNAQFSDKQNFRTFGNHLNWLIAHEYDNEIKVPDNNWEYKRVSAEYLKKKKECKGKTDMLCTKILNGTISWSEIYTKNSLGYYLEYGTQLSQMANSIEIKIKEYIKTNKTDIVHVEKLISFAAEKLSNTKSGIDIKKLKKTLRNELKMHYPIIVKSIKQREEEVLYLTGKFTKYFSEKQYCKAYDVISNNNTDYIDIKDIETAKRKCLSKSVELINKSINSQKYEIALKEIIQLKKKGYDAYNLNIEKVMVPSKELSKNTSYLYFFVGLFLGLIITYIVFSIRK